MQQNRDLARSRWKDNAYCPRIVDRIQKRMQKATQCFPFKSSDDLYEVSCPYGDHYAVNIKEQSCSCRRWKLTGISCPHAIPALWSAKKDPMQFVSSWYIVEKYLKCYDGCVSPMSGERNWENIGVSDPKPPCTRNQLEGQRNKEEEMQMKRSKQRKSSIPRRK
ncbi:uncharacterized protein LOC113769337 [Coffea eugenioides]|uniref:uncharacterized protein LOC113750732 n=1 Tax=Coffea eugenioides TaxID=49369 RepID=UPI000F60A43B|nr:uncharacterized protein LOC113750732 [Coffea eugenioides]XP_027169596.1 uncharacterized protein LOC113769337 [Coffea eugenioides]